VQRPHSTTYAPHEAPGTTFKRLRSIDILKGYSSIMAGMGDTTHNQIGALALTLSGDHIISEPTGKQGQEVMKNG